MHAWARVGTCRYSTNIATHDIPTYSICREYSRSRDNHYPTIGSSKEGNSGKTVPKWQEVIAVILPYLSHRLGKIDGEKSVSQPYIRGQVNT